MQKKIRLKDTIKPGMVFGELTIIEEDSDKEEAYMREKNSTTRRPFFKCQCSCGEQTTVLLYGLLRGTTKSCGHLRRVSHKGKCTHDLLGQKFGNLVVMAIDDSKETRSGKHAYWICKCELCGCTKSIRSSDLKSGVVTDCGCLHSQRISNASVKDLNGKKFGYLTVLERDLSMGYQNGVYARWMCRCELCGRIESVESSMLIRYGKDRCKMCLGVSLGETKIVELLDKNGISYAHDKAYSNFRNPETGAALRFDFRITEESECDYIIEFDGEQHFKPIPMWDSTLDFEGRKRRDALKNQWCLDRGIPMIRIPYTHLDAICFEDLNPETSRFLVHEDAYASA